jgi:hypothetical protein
MLHTISTVEIMKILLVVVVFTAIIGTFANNVGQPTLVLSWSMGKAVSAVEPTNAEGHQPGKTPNSWTVWTIRTR